MKRLLAYSPNLKQSWVLVLITMLCSAIIYFVMRAIMQYAGASVQEWHDIFSSLLIFTVVALLVVRLGRHGSYEPVASPRRSPLLWLLLVPFTLSISLATEPLTAWIPIPDIIKQVFDDVFQATLPGFLLIVILAPLCEEWLCRGIILKGLLKHYSPRKAIVWSAVIFSVLHLNPWQGVSAFCGALAIGWIYWRTRSLWCCIFMHAVNNAMSFLFIFFFPDARFVMTLVAFAGSYYIYLYIAILLVGVFSWIGIKNIFYSDATSDIRS